MCNRWKSGTPYCFVGFRFVCEIKSSRHRRHVTAGSCAWWWWRSPPSINEHITDAIGRLVHFLLLFIIGETFDWHWSISIVMNKNNRPSFIPCRSFEGRKEGYVFKNGDSGVGYYLDRLNPYLALASRKQSTEHKVIALSQNLVVLFIVFLCRRPL